MNESREAIKEFRIDSDWMRLYRDIEVANAIKAKQVKEASNLDLRSSVPVLNNTSMTDNGKNNKMPWRGRSTSIVHLHRIGSQDAKENNNFDALSHNSDDSSVGKGSGPSLLQRFTKTFSLRFGNGSSSGSNARKSKKVKYGIGSSPDLYHREE